MSQIYQPVMIRELLRQGGSATVEQIASAILKYDASQIEYYSIRVRAMVGRVLTKNGVVKPLKAGRRIEGYELETSLDPSDVDELIEECEARLELFLQERGDQIWSHRRGAVGYVPGSVRYEVLKRAHFRCELCGISADERALEVDHITPRNRGGIDDLINLQALCYRCNANKGDRDDVDFRNLSADYEKTETECVFCSLDTSRVVAEDELCVGILDGYPVTEGHVLVIPKRHVQDYFGLVQPELNSINRMLSQQRARLVDEDPSITGFNIGMNCGASAGQTVNHCHVHLIPRRDGDAESPRGGVRGVIPSKQSY
ncbi:MAG: HIT domain-containing protein [Alphaproteobacteria bacterium]|nr:HIT domain-containing protein [Alphaproteobacteria bacterium]